MGNVNHAIFEEWRNKTEAELIESAADYQSALEASRRNYDTACQAALERLGLATEDAEREWDKVRGEIESLLEAEPE